MGNRSKKSKKSQKRQPPSRPKKQYSLMENVLYYALAGIGLLVLISLFIALLGYFKVF